MNFPHAQIHSAGNTDKIAAHSALVLLFGEALVDVFPDDQRPGGAPFNVARHLLAFGLHPVLVSRTGPDANGTRILRTLRSCAMDERGMQTDARHPTGQVHIALHGGGHRFEILPTQAYDFIDADAVRDLVDPLQPALVYFGTLAQRHAVSRRALGALLRATPAPRLLDLNLREPWYDAQILSYSLIEATHLKLDLEELLRVAQLLRIGGRDAATVAGTLLARYRLATLTVTDGPRGAWCMREPGQFIPAAPGAAVEVRDTVGAGDGFAGVFILGLLRQWPMEITLRRADEFARAVCGIRGAVPPDDGFYQPFREQWAPAAGR